MLTKEQKKTEVANLSSRLVRSKSVFLVRFLGMTVDQSTALRKELSSAQAEIKVVKNTLFQRALKENSDIESTFKDQDFRGPNAVVFSYEDPSMAAKIVANQAKDVECLKVRFGWLSGSLLEKTDIEKLATLPSKPELQSMFLRTLQAPMSQTVCLFNEVPSAFVRTLNAKKDKTA